MLRAGSRLIIELTVSSDQYLVELSGEVDMLTARELETAVADLCAGESRVVVLDLRRVTFMDAIGLRSLFAAKTACREIGHELQIVPSPPVQRLFEVTGTEPDLPLASPFEAPV